MNNDSHDFNDFIAKISTWNEEINEAAQLELKRRENVLESRIEVLQLCLEQSECKINSLTQKIQLLVTNYAAFEPVLELKNKLTQKVADLETEITCQNEAHLSKEKHLQELLEEMNQKHEKRFNELQSSTKKEEADKEAEWKLALESERDKIKTLENTLSKEREIHSCIMEASKRQNHEELEKLRGQIALLQRSLSSKNMTNLDVFANKLQMAKEEFEQSLRSKNEELDLTKTKLKTLEDTNRYLKLVAVVRNVPEERNKQRTLDHNDNQITSAPPLTTMTNDTNRSKSKNQDESERSEPCTNNSTMQELYYNRCENLSKSNGMQFSKKRKLFTPSKNLL